MKNNLFSYVIGKGVGEPGLITHHNFLQENTFCGETFFLAVWNLEMVLRWTCTVLIPKVYLTIWKSMFHFGWISREFSRWSSWLCLTRILPFSMVCSPLSPLCHFGVQDYFPSHVDSITFFEFTGFWQVASSSKASHSFHIVLKYLCIVHSFLQSPFQNKGILFPIPHPITSHSALFFINYALETYSFHCLFKTK